MKKKSYIWFFILAVILGIGNSVYKHFKDPLPLFRSEINLKKDVSVSTTFNFRKRGCYEIGLWSDGSLFDGRDMIHKMQSAEGYPLSGKYTLSYYDGNKLIEKQSIKGKDLSSVSMDGPSKASRLGLDRLEIPYKDKYSALKIKLDIKNPKDNFKNSEESIFFFIDKTILSCGEKVERVVFKRKFNIDIPENNVSLKPLYHALLAKDKKQVAVLLDSQLDKEVKMIGERRPVHYASFMNDEKTLKYLLANNVDINAKDIFGKTSLHYGIENNSTKAVEILLKNGADLNLVEKVDDYLKIYGFDSRKQVLPLKYTAYNNLYEMTEILLKQGIDPNFTPIVLDKNTWNPTILKYLKGRFATCEEKKKRNKECRYLDYRNIIELLEKYNAK